MSFTLFNATIVPLSSLGNRTEITGDVFKMVNTAVEDDAPELVNQDKNMYHYQCIFEFESTRPFDVVKLAQESVKSTKKYWRGFQKSGVTRDIRIDTRSPDIVRHWENIAPSHSCIRRHSRAAASRTRTGDSKTRSGAAACAVTRSGVSTFNPPLKRPQYRSLNLPLNDLRDSNKNPSSKKKSAILARTWRSPAHGPCAATPPAPAHATTRSAAWPSRSDTLASNLDPIAMHDLERQSEDALLRRPNLKLVHKFPVAGRELSQASADQRAAPRS
ncbi:hypothetical protein GGX14DRAFT_405504 [Mycena pura]|uniref:Uncharacterized protein n=1 Tax=Mycena pura TaxID=153505 RepID=A0AAD6US44_9AGAR|nr:hypothetical protein GGX14DRAFT_405504 [Mycena pura]